ncbi:MAG: [Fe-Fe] hydrogenase large subunit C-terminal domain-containing protein [Bacteroidales bacterium]
METVFHHALKIQRDICIGCAHCMNVCPTGALRVRNGKAELYNERCIDCGECYRVCPVSAISVEQDDFQKIFDYPTRVALIPEILFGQFPENVGKKLIYNALKQIGFTSVFEVEHAADILKPATVEYIKSTKQEKPLISAFCPAIVRLIQVKFPSLVDHIILQKPPLDIAAMYYRQKLIEQGYESGDIGIFYITQCAAKIAAVKSPVGEDDSEIDGVINMDFIYNKIYATIKDEKTQPASEKDEEPELSSEAMNWSLTHGEANSDFGRCLAIDEIQNVMEFLEKVEDGEMDGIDFLELRACDESCAGGILNPANRFLAAERLRKYAQLQENKVLHESEIMKSYNTLKQRIDLTPVVPRSILKLDEDMSRALKKMKRVQDIMSRLPGVDCGTCGAPTCSALAQDIVKGEATLKDCIFIQRRYEQKGLISKDEGYEIMKRIWGSENLGSIK